MDALLPYMTKDTTQIPNNASTSEGCTALSDKCELDFTNVSRAKPEILDILSLNVEVFPDTAEPAEERAYDRGHHGRSA